MCRNTTFNIITTSTIICDGSGENPRHPILNHQFLYEGLDTIEEVLDRYVAKKEKLLDDEEEDFLYRDMLQPTSSFVWLDSWGVLSRYVFRKNERKEFKETLMQLTIDKLVQKQRQQVEKEWSSGGDGDRW
ncbi:hypothetical protein K2173_003393 [Erythroxylum novogranatense]|uniref:Uncharacterized protein n=1 Tax=Erythroxylum novogranatense TaxID=1862640 RepID=A0AAV8S8K7_9ROSI|nr:hypothetical protein K2173_003393 [Erythroxylum novogranatense]